MKKSIVLILVKNIFIAADIILMVSPSIVVRRWGWFLFALLLCRTFVFLFAMYCCTFRVFFLVRLLYFSVMIVSFFFASLELFYTFQEFVSIFPREDVLFVGGVVGFSALYHQHRK